DAVSIEREAQKIAQARDHAVGGARVAVDQSGDRVERVEEEVRVQLHLERLQLRAAQLRFKLRGERLALLIAAIVFDRVADADDDKVGQQVDVKLLGREVIERAGE